MAPLFALWVGVAVALPLGDAGAFDATETLALAPLPGTSPQLEVDALGARVIVRGAAVRGSSTLCPKVAYRAGTATLSCDSRTMRARLDVRKDQGASRITLVLTRLRGAPALDGDATLPILSYAGSELGVGSCDAQGRPDDGAVATHGECAFLAGRVDEAIAAFAQALEGPHHGHAALRLGDVAFLVDDVERAAAFWDSVGTAGPWTRLAAARLCDVLGACARRAAAGLRFDALDGTGLPDVAFDEVTLRHARVLGYQSRPQEAVTLLVEQGQRACGRAPALCRRLALEAMIADEARSEALALVLSIGFGDDATSAALVERAADQLAQVGVPRLGAELLTSGNRPGRLPEATLLRAAELYLESGDDVQAATIARYAAATAASRTLAPRWRALDERVAARTGAAARTSHQVITQEQHR